MNVAVDLYGFVGWLGGIVMFGNNGMYVHILQIKTCQ